MDSQTQTRIESRGIIIQREELAEAQLERFMEAINRLARLPLHHEQIHIRSMYLCSDRLCLQDWGQFSPEALHQICKLIVGQSVIAGHDRSRLPIARFFYAEVVEREDDLLDEEGHPVHWVRAWFYWLRETSGSRDLLLNIDGGIYREVSISWRYRRATCSVCGGAIQECPHVPGRFYEGQRCTFLIDEVAEVLEGSIVYKGAEPRTRFEGSHGERLKKPGGSTVLEPAEPAWPTQAELELCFRDLAKQPRCVRSLLVITDELQEALASLWLAKQVGLCVACRWLGPAEILASFPGGFDWRGAGDEEARGRPWDLIWVRLSSLDCLNSADPWWKRLCQRARFFLWQAPRDAAPGWWRKMLVGRVLPSPPWQLRSVEEGTESHGVAWVREER